MWTPKIEINKLNSQTYRAKKWSSTVNRFLMVGCIFISLCFSKYVAVEYLYHLEVEKFPFWYSHFYVFYRPEGH